MRQAETQMQTQVTASGKTGAICAATGPYKCITHTTTIVFFKKGEKFSGCPSTPSAPSPSSTGHSTTWSMASDS